jgi:histidine ammonia-lyase
MNETMQTVQMGKTGMTLDDLVQVARNGAGVALTAGAKERIGQAWQLVARWVAEERTVYGVTTGFGALSDVAISKADTRQLQLNVLRSHAVGVGPPLDDEIVRAMMALRVKDFARGNAGVRNETVAALIHLINSRIVPLVPEKGSVGASGDLVPLAHMALVLIGEGQARVAGQVVPGRPALASCGQRPLELEAGEGLALINGTQAMTAVGGLAVHDAARLAVHTDLAAAMSLEVLMGSKTEFDPRIHEMRPHPGQAIAAANMDRITRGSEIISSHRDCKRVQDAYTLRCSPQVHGASRDAIAYARQVLETEMNASTGNPLIHPETGAFLLGGNFHGQPVALALDFMCMAVAELANISERRIERLVNPKLSGLPAFLIKDGGLNSGFMIAQYVAAALVSENKVMSHPAVVDSIPTSANKEDHVSMGTISARKCREVVRNAEHVIAIELLCAAQGLDLFTNMQPGAGTEAAYHVIREAVPHLEVDRILSEDVKHAVALIRDGSIIAAVEDAVGPMP